MQETAAGQNLNRVAVHKKTGRCPFLYLKKKKICDKIYKNVIIYMLDFCLTECMLASTERMSKSLSDGDL